MNNISIEKIFKRDFNQKQFELEKITDAILKAMLSVKNGDVRDAEKISNDVYQELVSRKIDSPNYVPNVEEIQDLVEHKLMQSEFSSLEATSSVNGPKRSSNASNTSLGVQKSFFWLLGMTPLIAQF